MAIGLIKNNGGIPVTLLTYIYNSISTTSELKKGESAVTSAQTITHSGAFTHTTTITSTCGAYGVNPWNTYTLPDGTVVTQYYCNNHHIIGDKGVLNGVTKWDSYTSPCQTQVTETKTVTDCASNTSHGSMAYKLASTDNGIQISLVSTLKSTSISSYLWTFKPTSGSVTTIGTSNTVNYKGLGLYSCTVTFYDSNSASSTSHNYTQTFNLTISDYKKKRR